MATVAPHKPDTALHRALAELRRLRAEDRKAIVDLLGPVDRLRLEHVLRSDEDRSVSGSSGPHMFADAGYSAWLLARLDGAAQGAMTGAAAALLRGCAGQQHPTSDMPSASDKGAAGLFAALLRRRRREA